MDTSDGYDMSSMEGMMTADQIITAQQAEIAEMQALLES